ncbi:MAG: hypothetical protein IJY15_01345, partial [Thermoguttaceae bacterium]|nr:hypothetical protein [Thermoguttaceae bacterium]
MVAGIGAVLKGSPITGDRARLGDYFRAETNVFYAFSLTEVGANVYIGNHAAYFTVVSTAPTYGILQLLPSSVKRPTLSGNYVCADFRVRANSNANVLPVAVSGSATVRSTLFSLGTDATSQYFERFFDSPVTLKLQGDATVYIPSPTRESRVDNFTVETSEATICNLNDLNQTTCQLSRQKVVVEGSIRIADQETTIEISEEGNITLDNATFQPRKLKTGPGSRIDGRGVLVFPSNGIWINKGATINGVRAEDYDAASNDIKIVYEFDGSEIRNAFEDGVCRWTSEALDSGTLPFVFAKYSFDAQGKGDYRTIYDSTLPILDATAPVYETASDWNGETLKTVVHATPEAGWNYYRVEVPEFANLGGAKIYHGGQTTRYFVVWNADYEPEKTYYVCEPGTYYLTTTSKFSLTPDGIVKYEGAPTTKNANYVILKSATLLDCPRDHAQISVVFPAVVDVYDSDGRRLSDAEARVVSVGVPTPDAPEFYLGKGGTSGFWNRCDGATLYRVEAVDGSATGLTTSNRWLDANEIQTKTWRVRVAAPIYGGVEKWSTQTTAVQPFSEFSEKPAYDDATVGTTLELVYSDEFDGVREATIQRAGASDGTSSVVAQAFTGGVFTDVPETFDEHVYRVSWSPSPENVWLETTAAPWFVADGFDAKTQTNFITTPSRAYETPTFAARIEKKSNGELLKRQDVAKISYSLFETRDHWATRAERLAVGPDGNYWRRDVEISAATVRDSLLVDPNFWSL